MSRDRHVSAHELTRSDRSDSMSMASDSGALYDTVTYDDTTLTRSVEQSGDYAKLSDAYANKQRKDSFDSFSGSFDDPSAVLDEYPTSRWVLLLVISFVTRNELL